MDNLPQATVTILFTDLVGHTELYQRLGESAAQKLIVGHFRLLRGIIAEQHGREVKSEGDRLMVAFPSAGAGLRAAVAMQQAVARSNRAHPPESLSMRVGLNTGEPIVEDGDLFGTPVIVAQRLCDQAAGGQIVAAEVVRLLAGPGSGFEFVDPLVRLLKGIPDPVTAYTVAWGEQQEAPLLGRSAFVGRRPERERLDELLQDARHGHGTLALLSGEPGIGKTRLALELAASARALACHTFVGHAYDMEGMPPYLPIIEALGDYIRTCETVTLKQQLGDNGPALARLFPTVRRQYPDLAGAPAIDAETERYRIFEGVSGLLRAIAADAPVLLVLDDLHWADKPTLLMLQHLARALVDQPLLVVGTYRDVDVDQSHPLAAVLADLGRRRLSQSITLQRFDRDDAIALVAGIVGEAPAPQVADAIYRQTEGNPYFVEELVAHLQDEGCDLTDAGAAVADWSIPDEIRQVISARLARLGADAHQALTAAAILGDRFALDDVQAVSGLPADTLLDALDAALDAGVLRETAGAYRFGHALIRETLRSSLSTPRRQRLHLRAAQAVEALTAGRPEERAADIAYHVRQAGALADPATIVRWCTLAGDQAVALIGADQLAVTGMAWDASGLALAGLYDQAAAQYEEALRAGVAGHLLSPLDAGDLLMKLGVVHRGRGDWDRALESFTAAIDRYRAIGDQRRLAEVYYHAARVHARRLAVAEALHSLEESKSAMADDQQALRVRVRAQESQILALILRRYPQAEEAGHEALRLADELHDDALIAEALFALGICDLLSLSLASAAAALRRARSLAHGTGIQSELWEIAAATRGAIALVGIGNLAEAAAWANDARAVLERLDNPYQLGWARLTLAQVSLISGDFAEAETQAARGVDEGQRAGNLLVLIPCTWFLALLRCYRGDFAAAAELTRRLLTPAESDGPPHAAIAGWAYQAIVSALAGHPEDAGRIAHAIRDSLSPRPPDARAIAAFLSLAEIALLLRDAALAAAVYPQLRDVHNSGVLFPVGWPCLLPRVLGGLATLQGRFDEADRHLAVAVHIATALNARPELALSHVELARLHLGRPDSGPPTVALHHAGAAETIVRDLGMAGLEPYTRAVRAQAERAAGAPASLVSPGSARQNQTAS